MGRPERPLDRDGSPVRELAHWLRDLRNRSGMTYEQLAVRSNFSRATLQEALSGKRLPTLQVSLAIVDACGGDVEAWPTYWGRSGVRPIGMPLKETLDRSCRRGQSPQRQLRRMSAS
jgi:transcriptional regulator with XRE-family HTH domain